MLKNETYTGVRYFKLNREGGRIILTTPGLLPVADAPTQTREFTVFGALVPAFAIAAIFAHGRTGLRKKQPFASAARRQGAGEGTGMP